MARNLLDENDDAQVVEVQEEVVKGRRKMKAPCDHVFGERQTCHVCHRCGARSKHEEPGGCRGYQCFADSENAAQHVQLGKHIHGWSRFCKGRSVEMAKRSLGCRKGAAHSTQVLPESSWLCDHHQVKGWTRVRGKRDPRKAGGWSLCRGR